MAYINDLVCKAAEITAGQRKKKRGQRKLPQAVTDSFGAKRTYWQSYDKTGDKIIN